MFFYDNSYDSWVEKILGETNYISTIDELDHLYDNSLDDDPTFETMIPVPLINASNNDTPLNLKMAYEAPMFCRRKMTKD